MKSLRHSRECRELQQPLATAHALAPDGHAAKPHAYLLSTRRTRYHLPPKLVSTLSPNNCKRFVRPLVWASC